MGVVVWISARQGGRAEPRAVKQGLEGWENETSGGGGGVDGGEGGGHDMTRVRIRGLRVPFLFLLQNLTL